MRFWILAAITLMFAGGAIADESRIGVNSSDMRRIKITDDNGVWHMELALLRENTPDFNPVAPLIFATSLILNGQLSANTVDPFGPEDVCGEVSCWDLGRNLWIYVLYLKVGNDDPRPVLVLQPQMNSFGQLFGSFSTKAYLADNDVSDNMDPDSDTYPWGHRVMTEEVGIELRRKRFVGDEEYHQPHFKLEGLIPTNL
jgi:hypothetical protein